MRKLIFACSLSLILGACGSKEHKTQVSIDAPPPLEKPLNVNTGNSQDKYGIKDDTVKYQKTVYLEQQIGKMQSEITDLENKIYGQSKTYQGGIYLELSECRKKMADPRLGGNGVSEPMEKWEKISEQDPDYNYHVDSRNNVVAFSEENLGNKIDNLRKMSQVLNDKFDSFKTKLDNCQEQYNASLINHGMDPKDAHATGEWVDGPNGYRVWKLKKGITSDPEELMRRKQARDKKDEETSQE